MRKLFSILVVLVWAIIVVIAYYIYHKPFNTTQLLGLGATLRALGSATLVVLTAAGVGRATLDRIIPLVDGSSLERTALTAIGGLGLISLVPLLAGLVGRLHAFELWIAAFALLIVTRESVRAWLQDLRAGIQEIYPKTQAEWGLAVFVILLLGISLANAVGPVVGWDALLYHLTGPKWDIAAGRLNVPEAIPVLGYSPSVEMIFSFAMLLGDERAAGPIHWAFGLFLCGLVWAAGKRLGTARTAWLAVALLLNTASIVILMGEPYIDIALLAFGFAGLFALNRWRESGSDRWLILVGAFAGMAFGAKFTGGVVGVALGLVALNNNVEWHRRLKAFVIIGLTGAVLAAPWLFKNLALTGNPTYPFFFGGIGWDEWRSQWFSRPGTGFAYTAPWNIVIAPWLMSIVGEEGRDLWHATFGPLWLLLLPLLLLTWRRWSINLRRWTIDTAIFVAVLYAVWLYGIAESLLAIQPRLLFPVLPPLAILAALTWDSLAELSLPQLSVQRVTGVILAIVLGLTTWQTVAKFVTDGPGLAVLGLEPAENFLYRRLGWHYEVQKQINTLPADDKVVFLFEPRAFYCDPGRCLPDGILDRWWHARRLGGTASSILTQWQAAGATHVLIFLQAEAFLRQSSDPYESSDWTELALLKQALILEQNFGDQYLLYRIP